MPSPSPALLAVVAAVQHHRPQVLAFPCASARGRPLLLPCTRARFSRGCAGALSMPQLPRPQARACHCRGLPWLCPCSSALVPQRPPTPGARAASRRGHAEPRLALGRCRPSTHRPPSSFPTRVSSNSRASILRPRFPAVSVVAPRRAWSAVPCLGVRSRQPQPKRLAVEPFRPRVARPRRGHASRRASTDAPLSQYHADSTARRHL